MNHFFKIIDYIDLQISRLEAIMLAFGVIAMALNTIAGVISRFVFNNAIIVTDELNMIFIIIVTFAGISYAARNGRHIRMSAIYDTFNVKVKKTLMLIIVSITSLIMFFLSYYSIVYIVDIYKSGRVLPALGIPVFYIYLWIPIGFFITALQYAFTIVKNIQEDEVYISTTVTDDYCDIDSSIEI
jgi:C4-dicarboxylate transporter, DctQ subunit